MTTATRAKRFLAAAVLGMSTCPVWRRGSAARGSCPGPQEVSASQLFQGLGVQTAPAPSAAEPAGGIRWRSETVGAYKEAVGQGKPLVIFFSDDRCETAAGSARQRDGRPVVRRPPDGRDGRPGRVPQARLRPPRADEQAAFKSMEIKTLPTVAMLDSRNGRLVRWDRSSAGSTADAFFARFSDLMTRYADGSSPAPAEPPVPPPPRRPPSYGTVAPRLPPPFTPESLPGFLTGLGYEVKS